MKRDIFYSKQEGILFWVIGYTDNSTHVNQIIKMLETNRNTFLEFAKCKPDDVRTEMIDESRRYKHMRVMWCYTKDIPKEAFVIGDEAKNDRGPEYDWTMWKWLRD